MARLNREGDLFGALRGVPPMTDLSGRESLAKNVGPYGWRRESLAKYVGPYGWTRESLAKHVGPYGWRGESLAKYVGPYGRSSPNWGFDRPARKCSKWPV